ncbi:hypothetical protein [Dickeya poaceiphila]|uniref:Uncharacterized protein n=1 Tax=Dickeya poaceiphila TaxID=568768 RepID=A0A5B8I928_9GAMM|nr:hypothetical protein [Dickeya poaceiphila]QDX31222.1 hypothetical protein Dpoa569_0003213 [Dickeya poaceiphila]
MNMVIMMTLKTHLIKWLCLPIAISLTSIPSSYALTSTQYKALIYGAAAGGAWAGWGTLNSVLSYVARGDHTITAIDGANAMATICGATAASLFRLWNPPTDPVSAANVVMAATRAGAVTGTTTTCRWVTNAFIELYFNEAQNNVKRLSTTQKNRVFHDAEVIAILQDALGNKIDIAANKARAANDYAENYKHLCGDYGQTTRDCQDLAEQVYRATLEAKKAVLETKQAAWDLANAVQAIANDENVAINATQSMSPRPG